MKVSLVEKRGQVAKDQKQEELGMLLKESQPGQKGETEQDKVGETGGRIPQVLRLRTEDIRL